MRAFIAGLVLLAVVVAGTAVFSPMVVKLVAGPDFSAASAPLLWLALAYGLSVAGFYIRPTVVTLIGPAYYLITFVLATFAFMPALYFSITNLGIAGAGLAQFSFTLVWFILNIFAIARRLQPNAQ
jgi:O-antigen/teichoic acid export membrane protein